MKFFGKVIEGDGYGRKIGFPTVNISSYEYVKGGSMPKNGIYAGFVKLNDGATYLSGIVVGPENKDGLPKLEAHLIDYSGNLYGKTVTFYIEKYIRPIIECESEKDLIDLIGKDIEEIRKMNLCLQE